MIRMRGYGRNPRGVGVGRVRNGVDWFVSFHILAAAAAATTVGKSSS